MFKRISFKIILGFCVLLISAFFIFKFFSKPSFSCSTFSDFSHEEFHNAACLIVKDHQFLTVLNRSTNAWDFPGGTAKRHEPSPCVAQRETFEETGLFVIPKQKIHEYENGFSLYACALNEPIHEQNLTVPLLAKIEVKDIQWQSLDELNASTWRFSEFWPETKQVIEQTLMQP